jgi:protein-S-isoprenylcysteine O-methyltransferase Ste14
MDAARYYVALFIVAFSPGVFLYWFSIHPFIGFWRRLGPKLTLAIHYLLMLALAAGVFLIRKPVLSIEFGTQPVLIAAAAAILVFASVLRVQISKQLRTKTLMGLPELAPSNYENRLLTKGIYSRVRHPRYVELLLAFLAYALFANYLAMYVVVLLGVVWAFLVVRVEEKELRERFGEEYERYCQRVPRFLPNFSTGPS